MRRSDNSWLSCGAGKRESDNNFLYGSDASVFAISVRATPRQAKLDLLDVDRILPILGEQAHHTPSQSSTRLRCMLLIMDIPTYCCATRIESFPSLSLASQSLWWAIWQHGPTSWYCSAVWQCALVYGIKDTRCAKGAPGGEGLAHLAKYVFSVLCLSISTAVTKLRVLLGFIDEPSSGVTTCI